MHPLLDRFKDFADSRGFAGDVYIVGGAVRDMLSGIETRDIDLVTAGDSIEISREFAEAAGASFVLLDADFSIARVVKDSAFLDISPIRGGQITTDLADRDITINAMALPLSESQPDNIIDPFGGRDDLRSGLIRMVSEKNLVNDPLRILRVYRFSAALHAAIEENTRHSQRMHAPLLRDVAVERIAEELRHIMALGHSHEIMKVMEEDNILPVLFPELERRNLLGAQEGVLCLEHCEAIISNAARFFPQHAGLIAACFELPVNRICLKLAALFSGQDVVREAALRLKLSKKESVLAESFSTGCNRIMSLFRESADNSKLIGFLKVMQADIYPIVVLSLALDSITAPFLAFCNNILSLFTEKMSTRMRLLGMITGDDLIREFGLSPSPRFKDILTEIEDAILEGKINSRDEAFIAVGQILERE